MAVSITSPRSGANLDGAIQTFRWNFDRLPIEDSWIYAGSRVGGFDYGRRNTRGNTSSTLSGMPTDRSTVYVRLFYKTGGLWLSVDETFQAAGSPGLPTIEAPPPGRQLNSSSQTFRWNFRGYDVNASWLYIGDAVGGSDYYAIETGTRTSTSVELLPTDESTLYVRLYFKIGNSWFYTDETYMAAAFQPPTTDQLAKQLQSLVGVSSDGIIGRQSRAALNRNWLGRVEGFDPSFAERFSNDVELVRWVQERIIAQGGPAVASDGAYDRATEAAVVTHLAKGGIVAAESYLRLLEPTLTR